MTYTQEQGTETSVKDRATEVAQGATEAGGRVASSAKDAAQQVAGETKSQAKQLLHATGDEVRTQAASQQKRLAGGLRSAGDELRTMADSSESRGIASEVAQNVAGRVDSVASWLDSREPAEVLDEVSQFARRSPLMFIAIAAGAGIVAGRLFKSLKSVAADNEAGMSSEPTPTTPTAPAAGSPLYDQTVVELAPSNSAFTNPHSGF